jgi:hypothetical protein
MNLQIETLGADGQRAYDLNSTLAINGSLSVEWRSSWHVCRGRSRNEVENILVCLLESEVDREGWERCKFRVQFVQEMDFVSLGSNAICLLYISQIDGLISAQTYKG